MEERIVHYNLRIPPPRDAPRRPATSPRSPQQSVITLQLGRALNRSQGHSTVVSAKATMFSGWADLLKAQSVY